MSVLGMAALVGALLLISHGMRDNHQRIRDMLEREEAAAAWR